MSHRIMKDESEMQEEGRQVMRIRPEQQGVCRMGLGEGHHCGKPEQNVPGNPATVPPRRR